MLNSTATIWPANTIYSTYLKKIKTIIQILQVLDIFIHDNWYPAFISLPPPFDRAESAEHALVKASFYHFSSKDMKLEHYFILLGQLCVLTKNEEWICLFKYLFTVIQIKTGY